MEYSMHPKGFRVFGMMPRNCIVLCILNSKARKAVLFKIKKADLEENSNVVEIRENRRGSSQIK